MKAVVVGGTGTLGRAITPILIERGFDVVCLSRDELKQKQLKSDFPLVSTAIADVRDVESLEEHFKGAQVVFNLAALKHIDVCEDNPKECIKTNLIGAINVADVAGYCSVPYCVLSSTDKAVLPINIYGKCKSTAESYYLDRNRVQDTTRYSVYRWGNVIGSRGSVIHAFYRGMTQTKRIEITSPEMTRFWIDIGDAANFMVETFDKAKHNTPMIPNNIKAAKVDRLLHTVHQWAVNQGIEDAGDVDIEITGVRRGEKIHECLQSEHERDGGCIKSDDSDKQLKDHELYNLVDRALR